MRLGPQGHAERDSTLQEAVVEFEEATKAGQVGYDVGKDARIRNGAEIQDGSQILLMRPITGG